jgi:hypothetical protein
MKLTFGGKLAEIELREAQKVNLSFQEEVTIICPKR